MDSVIREASHIGLSIGKRGLILPTTFAETLQFFLDSCLARDLRAATLKEYRTKLTPFLVHLYGQKVTDLADVQPKHIMAFMNSLQTRNNANSRLCYHRALKVFFNWLSLMEMREGNPMTKMQTPKKSPSMARGLTGEELQRVIECAGIAGSPFIAARNVAIIAVLVDSGLRVGEMTALTMDDLWTGVAVVNGKQRSVGTLRVKDSKSRRARTVGIGYQAVLLLRQYLVKKKKGEHLWVDIHGRGLSTEGMKNIVRIIMQSAGVRGKTGPHRLRHTCAQMCVQGGGDTETLRRRLGHSSLNTTQIYVQSLSDEDVAKRQYSKSPLDEMGGK